jgi:FKBP-type peptidyl-prolyl cis-trans isomerase FkpA
MKLKYPVIAAFAAMLSLTACGGGGDSSTSSSSSSTVAVANPAQFTVIDTVVGTGLPATAGKYATVTYTGWLYSDTAADHKGAQFDSGTYSFTVGAGQVITGFDQGVLNMNTGGKRTVYIPSSMGYGAAGTPSIPPNAGLVFDIQLTGIQ